MADGGRAAGVLGIGDSITLSCGYPTGALPLASWAQWVARALGEPVRLVAAGGATSADVRRDLLPLLAGAGPCRLALVHLGANDLRVRRPAAAYGDDVREVLRCAVELAGTVVVLTLPVAAARLPGPAVPGARERLVRAYGAAVRSAADELGAHAVQAPELSGPRWVAGDRRHPTAAGQLAYADAAAWALRDLGEEFPLPSSLVAPPEPVSRAERRRWWGQTAAAAVTETALAVRRARS